MDEQVIENYREEWNERKSLSKEFLCYVFLSEFLGEFRLLVIALQDIAQLLEERQKENR